MTAFGGCDLFCSIALAIGQTICHKTLLNIKMTFIIVSLGFWFKFYKMLFIN
jgi:hypothetical protein